MTTYQYMSFNIKPDATEENLLKDINRMGAEGWRVVAELPPTMDNPERHMLAVRELGAPASKADEYAAKERCLWINKHQVQELVVNGGDGVPAMKLAECSHIFDARLLEEHPAACKIVVETITEHGGPAVSTPMWVQRKAVRLISRGEEAPELNRSLDHEDELLTRMFGGPR